MNISANAVIDHLGGTSAVAKLIEAPMSTVHSWRKNGIPHSRMAHLRLAARAEGKALPDDLSDLQHASEDAASSHPLSSGRACDASTVSADQLS